jgi:hypothetical protein
VPEPDSDHAVESVRPTAVILTVSRDELDTDRLRDWTRDKIVARIPGSARR